MLICMRAGISVCVVVMVLMIGVGVVCIESFFLSVVEVDCLGVIFFLMEGDIFELGGVFEVVVLEVEVENFEMVVGCVMRLVVWFLNWRGDLLWRLSLNLMNVGACLFRMVMWVGLLVIFGRGFLGKVVVVTVVIEVVTEVVLGESAEVFGFKLEVLLEDVVVLV